MKFNNIFTAFIICLPILMISDYALAAYCSDNKTTSPGWYCYATQDYRCPAGCYCTGGGNQSAGKASCDAASQRLVFGQVTGHSTGYRGVWLCPKDYPNSAETSTSWTDCYSTNVKGSYATCTGNIYNRSYEVPPGFMMTPCSNGPVDCLNSDYDSAKACRSNPRHVCPGSNSDFWDRWHEDKRYKEYGPTRAEKWWNRNGDVPVGCVECPDGTVPNEKRTDCIECPDGMVTKEDGSGCEKIDPHDVNVKPGNYLLKGLRGTQQECEEGFYCPGGKYTTSATEEQGKFECPEGTFTNKKRTACRRTFSKDDLKKGPDTGIPEEYQCWTYLGDIDKYKSCIFAVSDEEESAEGTETESK